VFFEKRLFLPIPSKNLIKIRRTKGQYAINIFTDVTRAKEW